MNIDWYDIYPERKANSGKKLKFHPIPKLIPWADNFEENISLTLEWLLRDSRMEEIRFSEEPIVNLVKDNWYKLECEEGRYIHVCFPKELLQFRNKYESVFNQINTLDRLNCSIIKIHSLTNQARGYLWAAWDCWGSDGDKTKPKDLENDPRIDPLTLTYDDKGTLDLDWFHWPREWYNACSRCAEPLPKSIRMWIKLQNSKLKGIN